MILFGICGGTEVRTGFARNTVFSSAETAEDFLVKNFGIAPITPRRQT